MDGQRGPGTCAETGGKCHRESGPEACRHVMMRGRGLGYLPTHTRHVKIGLIGSTLDWLEVWLYVLQCGV